MLKGQTRIDLLRPDVYKIAELVYQFDGVNIRFEREKAELGSFLNFIELY